MYFANNLYMSITDLRKMPDLKFEAHESLKAGSFPEIPVSKKAASYYLEKVRERNLFKMGLPKAKVEDKPVEEARLPSSRIMEATKDLRLVGISWSDDPDAMIENAKAMRTFFVKRGEMIGEIKVEAIFKDKVVLSYGGEEVELK